MNKWHQGIVVNYKEEEGKVSYWFDDENYKKLCEERAEQLKEIERLKEELKYTIPIVEHNKTIQSNINSYNKLSKYSNELEDRIDKAIEYIKRATKEARFENDKLIDVLDILKGVNKE